MEEPKLGKYRHYKGKFYEVIGIATHSETLEKMVVYKGLYESEELGNEPIFVRPIGMFLENVNVAGQEIPRFKYLGDDEYTYEE